MNFDRVQLGPPRGGALAPRFLGEVAGTGTVVMPVHFPHPTAGRIEADGKRFRYIFAR